MFSEPEVLDVRPCDAACGCSRCRATRPSATLPARRQPPRPQVCLAYVPSGIVGAVPSALAVAVLEADGFTPGAPPHLTPAMVEADAHSARASKCPRCRRHGRLFSAFHDASGGYRVLQSCPRCFVSEEA